MEYWDSPLLKVFHGKVGMKFDDPNIKPVRPTMAHFFYMDEKAPTKIKALDRRGRSDWILGLGAGEVTSPGALPVKSALGHELPHRSAAGAAAKGH